MLVNGLQKAFICAFVFCCVFFAPLSFAFERFDVVEIKDKNDEKKESSFLKKDSKDQKKYGIVFSGYTNNSSNKYLIIVPFK
jgi:hypothetical protein